MDTVEDMPGFGGDGGSLKCQGRAFTDQKPAKHMQNEETLSVDAIEAHVASRRCPEAVHFKQWSGLVPWAS